MKNIAKIFDLKNRQVVILKFYNNDSDKEATPYELHIIFDAEDDVRIEMKYSFAKVKDRDKAFNKCTPDMIEDMIETFIYRWECSLEEPSYDEDDDDLRRVAKFG